MTPFDGDAFFTSAITAGRRARSAAAKPRRGARVTRPRLQRRERRAALGARHVVAPRRDDVVEDHRLVNSISASSLAAAAPLSTRRGAPAASAGGDAVGHVADVQRRRGVEQRDVASARRWPCRRARRG